MRLTEGQYNFVRGLIDMEEEGNVVGNAYVRWFEKIGNDRNLFLIGLCEGTLIEIANEAITLIEDRDTLDPNTMTKLSLATLAEEYFDFITDYIISGEDIKKEEFSEEPDVYGGKLSANDNSDFLNDTIDDIYDGVASPQEDDYIVEKNNIEPHVTQEMSDDIEAMLKKAAKSIEKKLSKIKDKHGITLYSKIVVDTREV